MKSEKPVIFDPNDLKRKGTYAQIPAWVFFHPKLTPNDRCMIVTLAYCAYRNNPEVRWGDEALANSLGLSQKSIPRILGRLEKEGLIKRQVGKVGPTGNMTRIITLLWKVPPSNVNDITDQQSEEHAALAQQGTRARAEPGLAPAHQLARASATRDTRTRGMNHLLNQNIESSVVVSSSESTNCLELREDDRDETQQLMDFPA